MDVVLRLIMPEKLLKKRSPRQTKLRISDPNPRTEEKNEKGMERTPAFCTTRRYCDFLESSEGCSRESPLPSISCTTFSISLICLSHSWGAILVCR